MVLKDVGDFCTFDKAYKQSPADFPWVNITQMYQSRYQSCVREEKNQWTIQNTKQFSRQEYKKWHLAKT